jgi:phytoene dehydrogenase-like protein
VSRGATDRQEEHAAGASPLPALEPTPVEVHAPRVLRPGSARASRPQIERDADTLVIGSGLAGLAIAALLAADGERVLVLEAHSEAGGRAHTFPVGGYRFCSDVHAISDAGDGGSVQRFLRRIGAPEVRFRPLDPDGFDRVVVGTSQVAIPRGLDRFRARMLRMFPGERAGLDRYFDLLDAVHATTRADGPSLRESASDPRLAEVARATLAEVFASVSLSPLPRALLAGAAIGHLLPPSRASFLAHAFSASRHDDGAYYPEGHVRQLVDALVEALTAHGGRLRLGAKAVAIDAVGDRVIGVRTSDGALLRARRYVSNADPRRTASLLGPRAAGELLGSCLDYEYSSATFGLHLGLSGIDLREHGLGSFRLWHYPHADLDAVHARQARGDLDDPWLLVSSPTLHGGGEGLAPPGGHILHVSTTTAYAPFAVLKAADPVAYAESKRRIEQRLLEVIEQRYLPRLRDHIVVQFAASPTTIERLAGAPAGNGLGAALTPAHVLDRVPSETPLENLFLCNASTGWPSVAGTLEAGLHLYRQLHAARG